MRTLKWLCLGIGMFLLLAGTSIAEDKLSVGFVAVAKGDARILRADGSEVPLSTEQKIYEDDTILTGNRARVQIILNDDSVFTIGRKSKVKLETFIYDATKKQGMSEVEADYGLVKFVTGKIAKSQPQNVKVKTPFATIGVRGSGGIVQVADNGATTVGLTQCCLDVSSNGGNTPPVPLDNVNDFSQVNDPNEPPTPAQPMTPEVRAQLNGFLGEDGDDGTDEGDEDGSQGDQDANSDEEQNDEGQSEESGTDEQQSEESQEQNNDEQSTQGEQKEESAQDDRQEGNTEQKAERREERQQQSNQPQEGGQTVGVEKQDDGSLIVGDGEGGKLNVQMNEDGQTATVIGPDGEAMTVNVEQTETGEVLLTGPNGESALINPDGGTAIVSGGENTVPPAPEGSFNPEGTFNNNLSGGFNEPLAGAEGIGTEVPEVEINANEVETSGGGQAGGSSQLIGGRLDLLNNGEGFALVVGYKFDNNGVQEESQHVLQRQGLQDVPTFNSLGFLPGTTVSTFERVRTQPLNFVVPDTAFSKGIIQQESGTAGTNGPTYGILLNPSVANNFEVDIDASGRIQGMKFTYDDYYSDSTIATNASAVKPVIEVLGGTFSGGNNDAAALDNKSYAMGADKIGYQVQDDDLLAVGDQTAFKHSEGQTNSVGIVSDAALEGVGVSAMCEECHFSHWGVWAGSFERVVDGTVHQQVANLIPYVAGKATTDAQMAAVNDGRAVDYRGGTFGQLIQNETNKVTNHTGDFRMHGTLGTGINFRATLGNYEMKKDANTIGVAPTFNLNSVEVRDMANSNDLVGTADIDGGFFGNQAQEVGGQFSFQDVDNNVGGAGVFLGKDENAPH